MGGGWEASRAGGMTAVEPAGMQGLSAGSTEMLVLVVLVVLVLAGRGSFAMAMEMAGPQ